MAPVGCTRSTGKSGPSLRRLAGLKKSSADICAFPVDPGYDEARTIWNG